MVEINIKKANELMWAVKGQLIPENYTDEDIEKSYNLYFARMWGNHEYIYRLDGFEEAWKKRVKS